MFLEQKPKMQKIGEWWNLGSLKEAFTLGTKSPIELGHTGAWYVFEHIYRPIKMPTAAGMPSEWTYFDVGFNFSDLADMYALQYSGNFWPEYYATKSDFLAAAAQGNSFVLKKIEATIRKNIYKYMRLIELAGYTYNPLWNVDGEELYSSADLHGDELRTSTFDDTNTHTVSTYDAASKEESTDRSYTGEDGDTVTTSHLGTGQSVDAASDAFGAGMDDSDIYHADKRVRRGNVGLTKSTELAEAFREELRSSGLIQEFYDDLNQALLIPIY